MNSYLQYAQVPLSDKPEPFRIIFIMDGSGSMSGQYPTMLTVYKKLFSEMNNVEAFQFSSKIGPLEPFLNGGTNIQIAMEHLTQILERGVPQTNVCAVFVSDGDGSENAQTLIQRYVALQRKYQIVFISVAVGNGFPTLLSNKLRNMIHNGTSTVPAILPVDRNEQFEPQFRKVLQYANQQKLIQIQNQVLRQPWNPPTNMVYPGEVVAVNDNEGILKTNDGRSFVPNITAPLTSNFIFGSLQLIIQLVANQHPNQNQYLDQMINYVYDVRKIIEDQGAIHKVALYVDLGKVVSLLEDIKSKKIDILKIGDQKLKEIMLENNPDKNQNTDSKLSTTSQVLFQQAKALRLDIKLLESMFTEENKLKLLEKRRINERFQLFTQFCGVNQQLLNSVTQNQPLFLQLVDSQLLFLK